MPFQDDTPLLEKLRGGEWLVRQPGGLVYETNAGQVITVPEGFQTNLTSSPWWIWPLIPRDGDYTPAAIVHDWLYGCKKIAGQAITRAEADGIMLEAMEPLGVGWLRRWTIWSALRVVGWWAWWKGGGREVVGSE